MKAGPNNSNQRVGIFVDVSNLYHSAKNLYQGRVNYAELIKHLVGGRQLIRAMAYVVRSEGVEPQQARTNGNGNGNGTSGHGQARMAEKDQTAAVSAVPSSADNGNGASSEASFFEALEKAGLELRMKDLQIYAGGLKKGDWHDGGRDPHDAIFGCDYFSDGRRRFYPARQLHKMGRRASGRDRVVPEKCIVEDRGSGGRVS
jgi:hypothetical protein